MINSNISIRDIQPADIKAAADILTQAFAQDPVMNWIFGDQYQERAPAMFEATTRYCMLYGKAFCTTGMEAVALRKLPSDKKFSLWKGFRSGFFALPKLMGKDAFKRLMTFDKLIEKERHRLMGKEPFWYCWCLATRPEKQGQGFGTALMNHTFKLAQETGFPCYLETAKPENQLLYEKNGYVKRAEIQLTEQIPIICMLRENA
ncbi:GNAT family N-acetyltransferase [Legionella jordanis]|uniref:Acetyltransferase (GNAT) family protein n=1 Tax=Legionella jordanis TaxID=456 RepID=A0A0W0VCZ7_9GAMM|nr:GNAT family N-acetyltransferase [Legionella jordanis]KTD18005.1 Acetyltransferase (GNAT) family protein [Legionella jordanis]RMX02306.1 N-acetyltransferase [Legionella jordanis]RMX21209.1 N-acetyltransferase [Legionella jordanis]VEH13903.1 Predicted acetyltransferase [Legionella jordanis]HAT8714284.1 GNAT family N-acetyltransferase [Legionella jordanis]